MITVVLDANVFISALITGGGKPDQIISLIESDRIKLFISEPILEEIQRVLAYPHINKILGGFSKETEQRLMQIIEFANIVNKTSKLKVIKEDPDDDKYLECAIEGKADYIISGDKHLKDLKEYQGIKIVDPASFLKIIEK